jgi:antitoxin component YwqK of YwqJK toxin-antitoxin module
MKFPLFAFYSIILLVACKQSDIETIEIKDANQQIVEQYQQRKKNHAKDGFYKKFGMNNVVLEEATYKNNQLDGLQKFFYSNGVLEISQQYVAGVLSGKYQKYYESGKIALEQDFTNGIMQGLSTAYYENGNLKEKVTMQNNEENGPFIEYYENGKIKTEGTYKTPDDPEFVGNKEHGILKMYDENGVLEKTMQCEIGVCKTVGK